MSTRYWLLLEKSEKTRISKGIDAYQDRTGESYHYDSLVANSRQLSAGDFVVIRQEDRILGTARVEAISSSPSKKLHRRCPQCQATDIRERSKRSPKWKCGKCTCEFAAPQETVKEVISYNAKLCSFSLLESPSSVRDVKLCSTSGDGVKSQLSILELDGAKIQSLLGWFPDSSRNEPTVKPRTGQGFGLSPLERRQVELRAMRIARELYENLGWQVIDTSETRPYDLFATRDEDHRFIEVKGTVGDGRSVILTQGEVAHARQHIGRCALVIVSRIILDSSNGGVATSGGMVSTHADPWRLEDESLEPTEYRYHVDEATNRR